jgi:hypothetical protein
MFLHGMNIEDPRRRPPDQREHLPGSFDARPLHQRPELVPAGGIPEINAAKLHETWRLQAVGELFSLLAILACRGVIDELETVEVVKAHVQQGTGSEAQDTEAAHRIPGQVLIGGISLQQYLQDPPAAASDNVYQFLYSRGFLPDQLQQVVMSIFARTDVAMSRINKTDSLIENQHAEVGLKEVLELCAGCAVSSPLYGKLSVNREGRPDWDKAQKTAAYAFQYYRERAIRRVIAAEGQKMGERNKTRSTETAALEQLDMAVLILRAYLHVLHTAPDPPPVIATGFHSFRARFMRGM